MSDVSLSDHFSCDSNYTSDLNYHGVHFRQGLSMFKAMTSNSFVTMTRETGM